VNHQKYIPTKKMDGKFVFSICTFLKMISFRLTALRNSFHNLLTDIGAVKFFLWAPYGEFYFSNFKATYFNNY